MAKLFLVLCPRLQLFACKWKKLMDHNEISNRFIHVIYGQPLMQNKHNYATFFLPQPRRSFKTSCPATLSFIRMRSLPYPIFILSLIQNHSDLEPFTSIATFYDRYSRQWQIATELICTTKTKWPTHKREPLYRNDTQGVYEECFMEYLPFI